MLNGKSILITGATGSFGRQCCRDILKRYQVSRLVVYSRDELKQLEMQSDPTLQDPRIRFFLGDVRDKGRLSLAMQDIDYVIHAAALKQVPAAEYNPHEFIKTNITGAMNIVDAALENNVEKVIALSTDKAVNPINLYGATKLCSDKIFIAGNSYSGKKPTRFSIVRYGNVIGSRGSVIPLFLKQRETGTLTVTDLKMTRFLITLEQATQFVFNSFERMRGGELFIPKIKSCSLEEIVQAIAPECTVKIIGLRPGEKRHELLIPEEETHLTLEFKDYYLLQPTLSSWSYHGVTPQGTPCPEGFSYSSSNNPHRFSHQELQQLCEAVASEGKTAVLA